MRIFTLSALVILAAACTGTPPASQDDGGGTDIKGRTERDGGDTDGSQVKPDLGCTPQYVHKTGFLDSTGQAALTWTDCVAPQTYDLTQAMAACEAYRAAHPTAPSCVATTCNGADTVSTNYGAKPVCTGPNCVMPVCGVWSYTTATQGHVGDADNGCMCPQVPGSPFWD